MSRPVVTVLLPIHNGERWIARCIESLLAQTFTDLEIHAIDDGSDDCTLAILRRLHRSDSRLRVWSFPKAANLAQVLNSSLSKVTSEYVARMDVDDISHPCRFQTCIEYLNANPEIDIVGTSAREIDALTGEVTGLRRAPLSWESVYAALPFRNPMIHPSVMIRTDVLKDIGGYPDSLYAEDYALWVKAAIRGVRIANIDEPMLDIGKHEMQVTRKFRFASVHSALSSNKSLMKWLFRDQDDQGLSDAVILGQALYRLHANVPLDGSEVADIVNLSVKLRSVNIDNQVVADELQANLDRVLDRIVEPDYSLTPDTPLAGYDTKLKRRMSGYERGVPLWLNDTVKMWNFVRELGVKAPELRDVLQRGAINYPLNPDGETLLTTLVRSNYADFVQLRGDDSEASWKEATAKFEEVFSQYQNDSSMVVAEVPKGLHLTGTIYRFFAFSGEIVAVLQERRARCWSIQLWKHAFAAHDYVGFRSQDEQKLVLKEDLPIYALDLLHAARVISISIPTAFARLDFAMTHSDPLFIGAQLFPAQFTPSHALECSDELLTDMIEYWEWSERRGCTEQLAPPAKYDPRFSVKD